MGDNLITNRLAKAERFADFLQARDIAHLAKSYSAAEWAELAAQMGENPPSEQTVMAILVELHNRATEPADPFEGLDV